MSAPASIGLIIPSGNRLTEPQFNAYAPPGVGIHVTRLRMTGKFRKPLSELKRPLVEAAEALSDVKPGMIVFHCTANSMESGLAHEKAIIEIIEQASGCPTITTAQAITQAFDRFGIKKLVLISPYVKATNQLEVNYLTETGYTVLHELGLGLETHAYSTVTPQGCRRLFFELHEHAHDRSGRRPGKRSRQAGHQQQSSDTLGLLEKTRRRPRRQKTRPAISVTAVEFPKQ